MRTKRIVLVVSTLIIMAATARWWLPWILQLLKVNGDLIQALDSLISIFSNIIIAVSAIAGYLLWKDQKTETETLDQRNRRILLGHVENFWVKGILEKSLYGAALLELGIKEEPNAVKTYPQAIKREATGETLPTDISMLEIFEQVGLGRSLLILGAPGSGKTTMLIELARELIERARQDTSDPIPMVFNLSSWMESKTLTQWLAEQLNLIYYVPKKTTPDWVSGNKLLLLLDGLDEVRAESRGKCVDAINVFRRESGLTSLVVCSRSQDYAELKMQLSFDGAIEIQPLASNQVDEYFERFGEELTSIRQMLKENTSLGEMAETPLFLNIMVFAYRNVQSKGILISENIDIQRKYLFDTYITRMFVRPERSKNEQFKKQNVLRSLAWLGHKMIDNQELFFFERVQRDWLSRKKHFSLFYWLIVGLIVVTSIGASIELFWLGSLFDKSSLWVSLSDRATLISVLMALMIAYLFDNLFIVENYTVRFSLAYNNIIPWRLIPFLDYCTDLIFLRRVGGGYIFVHRLLMEHFAEMYTEKYAKESQ